MNPTLTLARQLIVIDSQVNNCQSLANNINADYLILVLQPGTDGPTQIRDYLNVLSSAADFQPLQSIHIISYGSVGSLLFSVNRQVVSTIPFRH